MKKEDVTKKSLEYAGYKPRKAVKLSKREYNISKRALKKAKVGKADKEKIQEAKDTVKLNRKVLRQQYKRNGGSVPQKAAKKGYGASRQITEEAVSEHDVMGDIAGKRQKIRQSKFVMKKNQQFARATTKAGKKLVGTSYSVGNRGYNFMRGNGFTRTLKADRWETKLANRLKRIRQRVARTNAMRAGKAAYKAAKWATTPLRQVLLNPLSLKAYLLVFVMVVIAAAYMGNPSAMQQSEFHLNDSWLHFSKLDRLKSNDEVDYWTNIDEVLQYTNFVYQDYGQGDIWEDPSDDGKRRQAQAIPGGNSKQYDKTMADMEYSLWQSLNGDKDDLKTMKDLYGKNGNPQWKLSSSELTEFEELLEASKETGYYVGYQELDNPLFNSTDDSADETVVITKRFGYVSKKDVYNRTIIQVSKGKQLYASMAGKVTLSDRDVTIESSQAKFTYYNISEIRVKTGDTVTAGQEIAKVNAEDGLEISYQKAKTKGKGKKEKKEWVYVNPGFYFPSVHYNQTTSVLTNMNLSGDVAERIRQAADYVKKYEPQATTNGISAMLGNFWTESSINPKRAEGDYLNPPVGASSSSWDDESWLSMGGPAIYDGGYPNILHRGLGLGQWTDTADGSNRHTLLLAYAKSKGKKWYDLELQIDFIFNGDSPYYRQIAREILTSHDDIDTLTQRFLNRWEGNAGDKLLERQNNAKQVAQYLNSPVGGSTNLVASWDFPEEYRNKLGRFPSEATVTQSLSGNTYPVGQCTWYVYNRLVEAGQPYYNWLGNGQDWVGNLVARGWTFSRSPQKGAVMSESGGFYGHVAYVEYVNPDGSFLISECNYAGVQNRIHWRVMRPQANQTFAISK